MDVRNEECRLGWKVRKEMAQNGRGRDGANLLGWAVNLG